MNVYHEETLELIQSPDLSLGYTYPGRRFVAHHEAVEEVRHLEVMRGSEAMNGGKGLRGPVIDVPASPAWDEYEDCLYFHPYTEEELAEQPKPDGVKERLTALEDELSATKILLGVE